MRSICRWVGVFALVLLAASRLSTGAEGSIYRSADSRECPILDMPFAEDSGFGVGYVTPAETTAAGWGELSAAEIGMWGRFGNWESDWGADLDLLGQFDTMVLAIDSDDLEEYPLTMARLRLQWSQRFEGGFGFELDTAPGLYSGLESFASDDFAVPFGGSWIVAFGPGAAAFIGATVYPTFDEELEPRVGLRLAQRDSVILDLAYPESRLVLAPHKRFRLVAGAQMLRCPEYNMGNDERERLRYDETRVYGGLELGVTRETRLSLQGGMLMDREFSFEAVGPDVEVEDAPFFRVGLSRML